MSFSLRNSLDFASLEFASATRVKDRAAAQNAFYQALVGPTKTYIDSYALADRNLVVGKTEARVDYVPATHDTDLKTAKRTYASAQARASGELGKNLALAEKTYALAAGPLDLTLVHSRGLVHESFTVDTATLGAAWRIAQASADAAYQIQETQSYADALADLALAEPTPWSEHAAAKAQDDADWLADLAAAFSISQTADADAAKAQTISEAAADRALADLLAGASVIYGSGVATARHTLAVGFSAANNALAFLGLYEPTLPAVPAPQASTSSNLIKPSPTAD